MAYLEATKYGALVHAHFLSWTPHPPKEGTKSKTHLGRLEGPLTIWSTHPDRRLLLSVSSKAQVHLTLLSHLPYLPLGRFEEK